jgi:hypothetical protein
MTGLEDLSRLTGAVERLMSTAGREPAGTRWAHTPEFDRSQAHMHRQAADQVKR